MIAIVAGTQNVVKNNKLRPTHSLGITMYLVGTLYILSVICDARSQHGHVSVRHLEGTSQRLC